MRLQDGADPVDVVWSFADRNADLIGVPTPFSSANWELNEPTRFLSYLGEQAGPRPWRNGQRPAGLTGKRLCFPVEWFTTGTPAGISISEPIGNDRVPSCCEQQEDGQGGVWVQGTGKAPPCNCLTDLPDVLKVSFTSLVGCAAIAGVTTATRNVGTCTWSGSTPAFLGVANFTLTFSNGTWILNIDCFLGTENALASGEACSPLDVTINVTDDQACCSFAGGTYTCRIQTP